ncbi:hypothetical protein NEHOM01_2221 [Nematocida homosporus]|uniref:uncharacterized protein n=1 Tax=Nematocida homosporus TaxID=1912981 RepID=UPI00221F6061|nr:uncharacterized protein NEHOM01_2221 [Nematocida homosporus]KAI5187494.1 hypothetical protein NEHOM01_2221 [Nematocida homosporus]
MTTVFALCIPFIDISIKLPNLVNQLGLAPNEMTLYHTLSSEAQAQLLIYLNDQENTTVSYGGMLYNTCMEISKSTDGVNAVFIGPFSTQPISNQVFYKALAGRIDRLTVRATTLDTEPGICFVIPNGQNRAFVTKPSPCMIVDKQMTETLFLNLARQAEQEKASIVYIAGYTVESSESLQEVVRRKKTGTLPATLCFNLSDPGVLIRSYQKVKPFIKHSDWIIGNKDEFTELYHQITGIYPSSTKELYACIQKETQNAVITCGPHSVAALYKSEQGECISIVKPPKVNAKNTTGAGDVFAAVLLSGIARHRDIEEILHQAVERTTDFLKGI